MDTTTDTRTIISTVTDTIMVVRMAMTATTRAARHRGPRRDAR